jgi:hypothetical protein
MRTSKISNYQTRHLSPQDHGGWEKRAGWQLRPELIDLDREDLFVGVVEHFDESVVVLEMLLAERGVPFDGSYSAALNVQSGSDDILKGVPVDVVELDEILHERALLHLVSSIQQIDDFPERLAEFRQRCLARSDAVGGSPVPSSDEWHHVNVRDYQVPSRRPLEPSK